MLTTFKAFSCFKITIKGLKHCMMNSKFKQNVFNNS